MAWTLNGSTLAALSITQARLVYKNAAPDELTFTISPSSTPAFAVMADIVLALDGVVQFRGFIVRPGRATEATRFGMQYTAHGAWGWYERTIPAESRARFDSTGASTNLLTNEYTIGGSTLLGDHLSSLAAKSTGRAAAGTMNVPAMYPPAQTLDNMTVADCILTMLKFVTRYWAWFDYSVNPPTLNIATADQANYRTKTVSKSAKVNVTPAATAVDRVEVIYERSCDVYQGISSGVSALLVPAITPTKGVRRVFTDKYPVSSASTPGWINHLHKKEQLGGSDTIWRAIWLTLNPYTIGQLIFNSSSVNFWDQAQRNAFVQLWADLGISTPVGPMHTNASIQVQEVISDSAGVAVGSCYMLRTGRPPDGLLYRATGNTAGIHCARVLISITVGTNAPISSVCYISATPGTGAVKTRIIGDGTPDPVAGVAQMIYEDKNRVVNEGSVQALRDWTTGLNNFGSVSVPSIPATYAGVQQVEYVLENDRATITLGQTPTLSVDDMVATLRSKKRTS